MVRSELIALDLPAACTEYGLTLPEGLSFEEWDAIGKTLNRMNHSVMWWLGDWLNYGERTYGETYAQAVEATGYQTQTLQNAAYVASAVPPSRRREGLTWSHHAEVASKEPDEQVAYLERAQDEHLSVRELRRVISGKVPKLTAAGGAEGYEHWDDHSTAERLYPSKVLFDVEIQVRNSTMRKRGDKEYPREAEWFRPYPEISFEQDYAARVRDVEDGGLDGDMQGFRDFCAGIAAAAFKNQQLREAWVKLPSEKAESEGGWDD